MKVQQATYSHPVSALRCSEVISEGRPRRRPPMPPTRESETTTMISVNGIRMTACRKSVMTTAHSPPITQ
jgi:hypothetical protein